MLRCARRSNISCRAADVEIDDLMCEAQQEAEAEKRDAYAASLSLDDVLADAQLLLRFKRTTCVKGLGEENPSFLKELRDVRVAAEALSADPTAAWAYALPNLRTAATVYLTKSTSMKLEVSESARSAAVSAFAAAAKVPSAGVAALFAALEPAEEEVTAACTAKLSELRHAVAQVDGPMRAVGKARRTVVVVGGGIAGSLIGRWLDRHHSDKLDTILVDPKEYHDLTLMCAPITVEPTPTRSRIRSPSVRLVPPLPLSCICAWKV